MVEYGCNVANKFGFMSDDDDVEDPQELISKVFKAEADKAAAQKKAEQVAAKQAPSKDAVKSVAAGKENNRPSTAERGRGGRGRGRGGAPRTPREGTDISDRFGEGGRGRGGPRGRGNRPARGGRGGNAGSFDAPKEVSFEENPSQEVSAEGGRGRRGGRRFGGDRENFSGDSVGRGGRGGRGRVFDRHSGSDRTGVRGQEKKEGHGKGNWGTEKDEIVAEGENVEKEETSEPEQPREKTEEEIAYEAELEQFNKLKTLKEFKASQQRQVPAFKTRRAGEGTEENFGKLVPIKKEHIEDKEDEIVIVRKESNKKFLDINFQIAESGHRGGNRGAPRGRNNGPRGGGRGRGGHGRQSAPFDASLEAFPALGAK